MSEIVLTPLSEYEIEDLYDHWKGTTTWPAGDFFAGIENLVDLEKAVVAGSLHLFKATAPGDTDLFGVIVTENPVSIDLFTAGGEELDPSVGASVFSKLVEKAFEATGSSAVTKYLDSEWGAIHDQFEMWGFQEVISETEADGGAEAAGPEAQSEASAAEASSEDANPAGSKDTLDYSSLQDEPETVPQGQPWSAFELGKDSFTGQFAVG